MAISEDPWHSPPIAERFAVELSLPGFTTQVCRGWDLNFQPSNLPLAGELSNWLRHRRGTINREIA